MHTLLRSHQPRSLVLRHPLLQLGHVPEAILRFQWIRAPSKMFRMPSISMESSSMEVAFRESLNGNVRLHIHSKFKNIAPHSLRCDANNYPLLPCQNDCTKITQLCKLAPTIANLNCTYDSSLGTACYVTASAFMTLPSTILVILATLITLQ